MTDAAAARIFAALTLVCASYARADDPAVAAAPGERGSAAAAAARGAQGQPAVGGSTPQRSKHPPPAVIFLPLVGLVLLPLTLPVAEPRARRAATQGDAPPATTGSTGEAASVAAEASAPSGDRAKPAEPGACPACGPRQTAADPGAHP